PLLSRQTVNRRRYEPDHVRANFDVTPKHMLLEFILNRRVFLVANELVSGPEGRAVENKYSPAAFIIVARHTSPVRCHFRRATETDRAPRIGELQHSAGQD